MISTIYRALRGLVSIAECDEYDELMLVCAVERVRTMQLAYEIQMLTEQGLAAQARYDSLALTREEVSM